MYYYLEAGMDDQTYAWISSTRYTVVGRIHWGSFFGSYHLQDRSNELLWVGDPSRIYTPKMSYIKLCTYLFDKDEKWWWRKVWKLRCLAKARLLVWTNLENKIPTWDILQK